jgi:hypothetical protein
MLEHINVLQRINLEVIQDAIVWPSEVRYYRGSDLTSTTATITTKWLSTHASDWLIEYIKLIWLVDGALIVAVVEVKSEPLQWIVS